MTTTGEIMKRDDKCVWNKEKLLHGSHTVWNTSCDNTFFVYRSRFDPSDFTYCPYCGKTIVDLDQPA